MSTVDTVLLDDQARALIAKLNAETEKIHAEREKVSRETEMFHITIQKSLRESDKTHAETTKLQRETSFYPLVVAAGFLGGGSALTFIVIGVAKSLGWLS